MVQPVDGRRWAVRNAWRAWCELQGRTVVEVVRCGDRARVEVGGRVDGVFELLAGAGADVVLGGRDWVAWFGIPLSSVAAVIGGLEEARGERT